MCVTFGGRPPPPPTESPPGLSRRGMLRRGAASLSASPQLKVLNLPLDYRPRLSATTKNQPPRGFMSSASSPSSLLSLLLSSVSWSLLLLLLLLPVLIPSTVALTAVGSGQAAATTTTTLTATRGMTATTTAAAAVFGTAVGSSSAGGLGGTAVAVPGGVGGVLGGGSAEPRLMLVANRKDIRLLEVDRNVSRIVVDKTNEAVALSFIYSTATLFWTDVERQRILRAPMPGGLNGPLAYGSHAPSPPHSHQVVVDNNLGQVDGVACDWLTMKLYWTDSILRRIEVAELDGRHRKVLFWTNIELPRSIAVVPNRGLVFWTDWGEQAKIERASMDGDPRERKVIQTNDLGWPNGIAVDLDEARVYYCDAKVSRIYSMDLDGKDRQVIQKYEGHPYSIVVMGPNIYWTDWQNNSIYTTFKTGQSKIRKALQDLHLTALDIKFYAASQQPVNMTSPCKDNNGGCSHLCLLSAHSPGSRTCACPTGVRIRADALNCENGIGSMLFVARKLDIQAISLDTPDHTRLALPLQGVKHVVSVDFDREEGFLYWADDQTKMINRARLDGTQQQSVISKDLFLPDGIALDPVARNLYFVDAEARRIQVALLSGKHRRTIISEGLQKPRAIAVDSRGGMLYWTDWGVGRVERSYLDGTHRQTLISSDVVWPNGLALDCAQGKMYWGDAKFHRVEEANMDGSARRVLQEGVPHMFGLTLHRGYLYWSEWKQLLLERYSIADGKREIVASNIADMMMLWAGGIRSSAGPAAAAGKGNGNGHGAAEDGEDDDADRRHEDGGHNPCRGGGGCSHLCLNTPRGSVCACPDNMAQAGDGRNCVVEQPVLLVASLEGRLTQATVAVNNSLGPVSSSEISQVQAVGAVDYHWSDKSLFFVDSIQKTICRTFLNRPGRVEAVVKRGIERVAGLAVDWLTGNLYWTDADLDRLEMSRLNGAHRKVLLWKDMEPSALVVDPLGKQLYWVDSFNVPPRIEKCRLDGSKRSKLVDTKSVARSLSLDPIDKKVYWTDGESIESVELNGKSRRAVAWSTAFKANRLAVHGAMIFLSDSHRVWSAPLSRPDQAVEVWAGEGRGIADLKIMHRPSQLGWNHCALSNGDCRALCLAAPSKDKGYYCSCPTHYVLETVGPNKGSCVLPQNVLLFAQKSTISRTLLGVESPDVLLPIAARNVRALHLDPYSGHIFWLDFKQEQIYRSKDDGADFGLAFRPSHNESRLSDFAMDPLTGQLFWVCSYRNRINVARLMPQGDFKQVGVIVSLEKPRLPAVHPLKALLVFVNYEDGAVSIMSCSFDGSSLRTIFNGRDKMKTPTDLVVDTRDNLVFWSDSAFKRVESVSLDGDRHSIVVRNIDATSLAIHEDLLVVLSRAAQEVAVFDKTTGKKQFDVVSRRSHLSDVFALPPGLPVSKPHECPCSHVCLAHGESDVKFSCTCPAQYAEGSCDVAQCASQEWTCRSGGIRCIPLEGRCDAKVDCLDKSDELDCCSSEVDHFKCTSNERVCIAAKRICDGRADCPDGSDEKYCELQECGLMTESLSLIPPAGTCCPGGFRCQRATGRYACIPPEKICNEIADCFDRTEELSCCGTGLFQCHDSQHCIDASKVCDGATDCEDNSDEFSCCQETCMASHPPDITPNDFISPTVGDSAGIHWPVILIGIFAVSVIILVLVVCAKRDTKTPQDVNSLHYQVRPPGVTLPLVAGHPLMKGAPSAPASATSSDPSKATTATSSSYPYNPPPSPATVQSYESSSFYHQHHHHHHHHKQQLQQQQHQQQQQQQQQSPMMMMATTSMMPPPPPSSTCSSSQFGVYVGSDASFPGGMMALHRGRLGGGFSTTSTTTNSAAMMMMMAGHGTTMAPVGSVVTPAGGAVAPGGMTTLNSKSVAPTSGPIPAMRGQRPNTPCSTDACDDSDVALYQYNNYNVTGGYVPPPASPIPTERSFLYSDISPNTAHTDPRFV